MKRLYIDGNNGGDQLDITVLDNGLLKLSVGHCCIREIYHIVPVEFVTAALTKAVLDAGGVEEFIRQVGWSKEFTGSLLEKVRELE